MSGIVGRQVETNDPWGGLPPRVHATPALWVGFPGASGSNNLYTTNNFFTSTATAGANYSWAPATQIDYARNVNIRFSPNTASAGLYSQGTVIVYGKDYYGNPVSESRAISAIASATAQQSFSVNFARVEVVSVTGLQFHSASSTARSDVSLYMGQGQKLGLPVYLQSTAGLAGSAPGSAGTATNGGWGNGPIMAVYFGTAQQTTCTATASSTNNQFTVVTGPYSVGGLSLSSAMNSGSALQVHYMMNGRAVPYEPGRND